MRIKETKKMATVHEEFNHSIEHSHTDLYKELEVANLESCISKKSKKLRNNKNILSGFRKNLQNKDGDNNSLDSFDNKYKPRGDVIFHRNMRVLVLCGQFMGLNPFLGILGDDTSTIRFSFFSYKVLYSIFLLIFQTGGFMLCWHTMFEGSMSISTVGEVSFYGAVSAATCMFLRVAMKWPSLVQDVAASKLEEYMDPRMKRKCNIAAVVLFTMALVDYTFALISRITIVLDCQPADSEDIYLVHTQKIFKLFLYLGIQHNKAVVILCQVFDLITTLCWNFPHVFIICMSFYLSSILEMINKKIVAAKETQTSLEFWKSMREDYSRATELVRKFDDVISAVIFTSFVDNLFFICLSLFNVLSPFHGYEQQIYFYYSFCHIFVRALLVALIASNVHSASTMVAPALYELPSSVYCKEVQRFIDQVHNEQIALSGFQFFEVTKELILPIGATIVTYELVLLQLNNDETIYKAHWEV